MYIVFIDESGQPGGFDKESKKLNQNTSKYFTLSGFMIDSNQILNVESKLKDVKLKYGLNPMHEIKWHTTYSKIGLDFQQYMNMKKDVINIISQYKNSVIGIVMDKAQCYLKKDYINNSNDLYAIALHLLMERYCMEITRIHGKNSSIPAMILADSRKTDKNNKLDKELQIAYLRAKNMGTYFVKFPNFCESIVFVDSDYFSGVQLADFCAGSIHKKYEDGNEDFFNELMPAIVSKNNNIYGPGIKIYK